MLQTNTYEAITRMVALKYTRTEIIRTLREAGMGETEIMKSIDNWWNKYKTTLEK